MPSGTTDRGNSLLLCWIHTVSTCSMRPLNSPWQSGRSSMREQLPGQSYLTCSACGGTWPLKALLFGCQVCGERGQTQALEVAYDLVSLRQAPATREAFAGQGGTMWRFAPLLPVGDEATRTTLGEGWTPLVTSTRLGAETHV